MSRMNLMRLTSAGVLLAVAGLAQTASATVVSNNPAAFTIDFPIDPANVERCGPRTNIQFDLAAGLAAVGVITNGGGLTAALVGLDANGNAVTGAITDVSAGLTIANYDNVVAANNANLVLNLAGTVTTSIFNNPAVVNVAIRVSTANNNINTDGVQTNFDGAVAANNDCLIADSTRPNLQNVFVSQDGNTLFFVFSESLNTGAAANDINHTVLANINATDFQVSATSTFLAAGAASPAADAPSDPTNLTGAASFTAGSSNTVIQFTRNVGAPGTLPINAGTFVRLKSTAVDGSVVGHQVNDRVANQGTSTPVAASTVTPVSVVSAALIQAVPAGGGNVVGALRVVFNNPLNTTGYPVAAVANGFALLNGTNVVSDGGAGTEFVLGNVVPDPNNPNAVLVDISSTGAADGIGSDGRLDSSNGEAAGALSVRVSSDTVATIQEVQDIFGSTFGAGSATSSSVNATDAIAPSLVGGGPAFLDENGDGAIDAVALVFDEPVADTTSAAGFELAIAGNVNVLPAYLISTGTGALTGTQPATVQRTAPNAENGLAITGVARGSIRPDLTVVANARTTNNSVIARFNTLATDWDDDGNTRTSTVVDDREAVPGNRPADANAIRAFYNGSTSTSTTGSGFVSATANVPAGTIADAAGNRFATTVNANASFDRASPAVIGAIFFTGDNQTGGGNNQLLAEADGTVGDGNNNNRIALIFSEAMSAAGMNETLLQIGSSGNTFNTGDHLGFSPSQSGATGNLIAGNILSFTLNNATTQAQSGTAVRPGVALSLVSPATGSQGFADAQGNNSSFTSRTAADGVAPYSALTSDVNQVAQSGGFSVDADNDGFVDAIRVKFTQNIDSTSLRQADFTLSGAGSLSGAPTVDSSDNSIVVIPVTDGVLSINNSVTLTYNGAATGALLVRAQASPNGNGLAVDPVNSSITINSLQQPIADTREVATMLVTGNITTGSTPVPVGTKVFMMNAVPTALSITAVHNNTEFTVGRFGSYSENDSIESWTNWLLQLERDVYLQNDEENEQTYQNCKLLENASGDEATDLQLSRQVIRLTPNASNLSNITFTGNGQSASERVTNGRVNLCWDVLRSSAGTLRSLYDASCGSGGYTTSGAPILSRAVVTDNTGNYVMHHSGPTGFGGRPRLDATGRPVIVIVEFPDGRRFVASSLLTSVNGRPLLFRAQQGNTNSDGSAQGGVRFDINLANIAGGVPTDPTSQIIWPEWNTVSFGRDGGFATAANNLPLLPAGVTPTSSSSTRVVVGTTLTAVNALNQFVWFRDSTSNNRGDGMWTSGDDGGTAFSNIVIDYKCLNTFAFAMTSRGVQIDSGITGFTGGYAAGIFNTTSNSYGVFQFGPRFGSGVTGIFGTGSSAFPVNGPTRGWVLAAAAASATDGGAFLTANADSDYAIRFNNKGPKVSVAGNPLEIDVTSQSRTANGTGTPANANNLGAVPDEAALFVHYDR
ncbi:MAG: beta strand repeat-containing protein [Phycisphaerales bacterium]